MKKTIILLLFSTLLLPSCGYFGSKKSNVSTHFPFKESKNDKWGLIDANGKVLVENEFSEEPSTVVNGMFFVETDNGYEMYNITKPLTPVGDVYHSIAAFTEDITPAVKENEGITFIDKQGNVKFELPLEYTYARNFQNGYSIITKTVDNVTSKDAVSINGDIKSFKKYNIKQVLADGTFAASKEDEENTCYLLDNDGNVKQKINYDYSAIRFSPDGKYYVYTEDELEGLKSISGETIIRAKYDLLLVTDDGNLLFNEEEKGYGIMNLKGEVLIKPRYQDFMGYHNGLFIVSKGEDDLFGLINLKEERLIDFDYSAIVFIPNSDNLMAISEDEKSAYILDKNGSILSDQYVIDMSDNDELYHLLPTSYTEAVESDYFDVASCIQSILYPTGKSVKNLYGFAGMKPSDCADELDLSLSYEDIEYNTWFPKQSLETNNYGTISYKIGFDKVVDTYYEPSDYWELWPRYSYSDEPCNSMTVILDTNSSTFRHMDNIEKQIDKVMDNCGFSRSTSNDDYENTTWYQNSDIKVKFDFGYNLTMYVYVID